MPRRGGSAASRVGDAIIGGPAQIGFGSGFGCAGLNIGPNVPGGFGGCRCWENYSTRAGQGKGLGPDMQSDRVVTKTDVPYLLRDHMIRVVIVAAVLTWPVAAALWPDLRPGLIEVSVGLMVAPMPAGIWARAWISYVSEVALASRENAWLKWIPFLRGASYDDYLAKSGSAVLAGFVVAEGIVFCLWRAAPCVHSPWAHWSSYTPGDTAPSCLWDIRRLRTVSAAVFIMALRVLRWYASLPDGTDSPAA